MFDSLGLGELLVIGVLALVFVGPERIPHVAREVGRWYGRIRRMADELRRALVLEADRLDEAERLKDLRKRRQEAMEERRKMAEAHGSQAQPAPHQGEGAVASEGGGGAGAIPPGFTEEEWNELPPHVREIVLRRRGEP